ncbi:hypothetical protein BZA05DRAFT_30893 [Tricharina praecox]|uniref:uncharacterized protein n=1 Tax=Tricharina praecox TaxID=43433 RepID=UPI00221F30F5|nr:uncharacterized protein BZA05DRAFT_30893 [Tricharina praecox]KAI5853488.1 hypothetical protein BZA05DRAFT_30893 [Tricharina praecox]
MLYMCISALLSSSRSGADLEQSLAHGLGHLARNRAAIDYAGVPPTYRVLLKLPRQRSKIECHRTNDFTTSPLHCRTNKRQRTSRRSRSINHRNPPKYHPLISFSDSSQLLSASLHLSATPFSPFHIHIHIHNPSPARSRGHPSIHPSTIKTPKRNRKNQHNTTQHSTTKQSHTDATCSKNDRKRDVERVRVRVPRADKDESSKVNERRAPNQTTMK